MTSELILLAHGEGGRRSRDLVESLFLEAFRNPSLEGLDDGAVLPEGEGEGSLVFTTDSYVVRPLFFPGGDIGRLAVFGTCNDLAVMGARPAYLSCGFILEEGTEIGTLERIVGSMADACAECGVKIVTGDTKVVERGAADGLFINTSGVGWRPEGIGPGPDRIAPGDRIVVSGTIGDHGIAVLAARERLTLASPVESDVAPLWLLVREILERGEAIRFMRDPTRGGLATALCELASASGRGIEIDEAAIPVRGAVRGICEILGFDPLYVANEGKLLLVCAPGAADGIVETMRRHPLGTDAAVIGGVVEEPPGRVVLRTAAGGRRLVDMLSGEQLPRIC
jgi:hydrogenase expression/formation protein HypE